MASLDHERGRHAARRILEDRLPTDEQGKLENSKTKELKDYRSVVLGAGAYLRQAGLLQLGAFWLSKGSAQHSVFEDVLLWLQKSQVTKAICSQGGGIPTQAEPAALKWLVARTAQEIALLEAEAEAYLGWLKRVAEGLWKECNGGTNAPR